MGSRRSPCLVNPYPGLGARVAQQERGESPENNKNSAELNQCQNYNSIEIALLHVL